MPANASPAPPASLASPAPASRSSSGGVDVSPSSGPGVESPVSFPGLYGRIDTVVRRSPPGPAPLSLVLPLAGFASRLRHMAAPPSAPSTESDPAPTPAPTLLDPAEPIGFQFARGFAHIRTALLRVDQLDVIITNAPGTSEVPRGSTEAREARNALHHAEQDFQEAFDALNAAAHANANDAETLAGILHLLRQLQEAMRTREAHFESSTRRQNARIRELGVLNAQIHGQTANIQIHARTLQNENDELRARQATDGYAVQHAQRVQELTEQDRIIEELRQQNADLQHRNEELHGTIAGLRSTGQDAATAQQPQQQNGDVEDHNNRELLDSTAASDGAVMGQDAEITHLRQQQDELRRQNQELTDTVARVQTTLQTRLLQERQDLHNATLQRRRFTELARQNEVLREDNDFQREVVRRRDLRIRVLEQEVCCLPLSPLQQNTHEWVDRYRFGLDY